MTKRNQYLVIALIFALIGTIVVFYGYRTFTTQGIDAVAVMNDEERAVLARVMTIHRGMHVDEIYALLGEPSKEVFVLAEWDAFAGSRLSRGRIYFVDGKAKKFRWIKLGNFIYEIKY